ncbi:hypothetical protein [Phaeodactylibacter xiamenensis]|uniref:hypothetical protein n=1 Tax=Phaeodactylibacter xiamenensis TaxID=1524460 RepID=UPI003BACA4B3
MATTEQEAKTGPPSHEHNPTASEPVEAFLRAFEAGKRGSALKLLNEQQVYIIDADYLQRQADYTEQLEQNYRTLEKALLEVREERDILLKGLYGIYSRFGFVVEAVKKGMAHKGAMKGSRLISGVMKAFHFQQSESKEEDLATGNIIVSVIAAIRKNLHNITDNFGELGDQLTPGLRVLEKHEIIPPLNSLEIDKDEA